MAAAEDEAEDFVYEEDEEHELSMKEILYGSESFYVIVKPGTLRKWISRSVVRTESHACALQS